MVAHLVSSPQSTLSDPSAQVRYEDISSLWVKGMSGPVRVNLYDSPWVRLALTKAVWVAWRIVLPLFVLRVPAGTFWACFFIAELMSGAGLAWNFEVRGRWARKQRCG